MDLTVIENVIVKMVAHVILLLDALVQLVGQDMIAQQVSDHICT